MVVDVAKCGRARAILPSSIVFEVALFFGGGDPVKARLLSNRSHASQTSPCLTIRARHELVMNVTRGCGAFNSWLGSDIISPCSSGQCDFMHLRVPGEQQHHFSLKHSIYLTALLAATKATGQTTMGLISSQ